MPHKANAKIEDQVLTCRIYEDDAFRLALATATVKKAHLLIHLQAICRESGELSTGRTREMKALPAILTIMILYYRARKAIDVRLCRRLGDAAIYQQNIFHIGPRVA